MHSEVYTNELKKTVQEGEALWFPEPSAEGEVQIGDVGYIHEGAFMRLFNVIDPEKYPVPTALESYRLPEAFEPLQDRRAQRLDERFRALAPGPYKSKSVVTRKVEASASASVAAEVSVGAGMEYECTKEKGALLILKSDAKKVQASSGKTFEDYVAKHHDSWCKFVSDLGIDSAEAKKIVLVRGWVKTYPDWSVTVFTSSGSKFRASLDVKTAGAGGVTGSYSGTDYVEGPVMSRWGMYAHARAPKEEHTQNQCIFVKCVYAKRRWSLPFLRAGAGPHQLPDQRDANSVQDGPAIQVSIEQDQSDAEAGDDMVINQSYNPIDAVLDYILEYSNATIAVCSDQDLDDILFGVEWPEDVGAYLRETRPRIEVNDDSSVGRLSLEETIRTRLERELTLSAEDADTPWGGEEQDSRPVGGELDALPSVSPLGRGEAVLAGQRNRPIQWPHVLFKEKDEENSSGLSMSISPDGKYLATTSEDTAVLVWDMRAGRAVGRLDGHTDTVWAVAFAPDGTRIVSGSADSTAIIWDVDMCIHFAILQGHDGDVWSVAYSPDGSKIATGSTDSTVKLWDAHAGALLYSLEGHAAHVMHVAFSPDGIHLASCADANVVMWDAEAGVKVSELEGHDGAIWCLRFAHGSDRIVTGSEDNTARVWDVQSGAELVTIHEHMSPVWSVAFSPDDSEVVSGSSDCKVVASDSFSGEQLHVFSDDSDSAVDAVTYSNRGDLLASGTADGLVKLWDAKVGDFLAEYRGHGDKVKSVDFMPDDGTLVSSSEDGTVRAWSVRDVLRFF